MQNYYEVGKALGIKDPCQYDEAAWCVIVDGDSVYCAFFGSDAEAKAHRVCALLNETEN